MMNQEYLDLMNQELDGANSPAQSLKLEKYLSSHQEARTYYRELAQAMGVFEKVDLVDPPRGLKDSILAQVDAMGQPGSAASPSSAAKRGPHLLSTIGGWFRLPLQPAYAFTFLAGLAFGLVLYAGSGRLTGGHETDLYDSLAGTASHRSWNLEDISEGELELPGIVGLYRTMREGPDVRLHLKLRSSEPAVIKFRHGPHTTLQHYSSSNPAPANLTVSDSQVELNHRGRGSYDLVFHENMDIQTPITMLVFSGGELIKTQTLENLDPQE